MTTAINHIEFTIPGTSTCPPIVMSVPVYETLPATGVAGQLAARRANGRDTTFVWSEDSWQIVDEVPAH